MVMEEGSFLATWARLKNVILFWDGYRGILRCMSKVQLVGILNVTPNSFSDGGLYTDPSAAIDHANELFSNGAVLVDVGREATNPKVEPISAREEWQRLAVVLPSLLNRYTGGLSLDTYHPETVRRAARDLGRFIINDVTGFNGPAMIAAAAEFGLACIISHLPHKYGVDIQAAHRAQDCDSAKQVRDELLIRKEQLLAAGLSEDMIILDPGIGFGKTMRLNWELLEFAKLVPDSPVMIGHSRKRFLACDPSTGAPLTTDPAGMESIKNDPGRNLQAARLAIAAGADYLRVHELERYKNLTNR